MNHNLQLESCEVTFIDFEVIGEHAAARKEYLNQEVVAIFESKTGGG